MSISSIASYNPAINEVVLQTQSECDLSISVKKSNGKDVLFIEPFYGGSHKQLIDQLTKYLPRNDLIVLSAKKWPWRARVGALVIAERIPEQHEYRTLFCSSVLCLADLLGLRPDLHALKKVVYFHENQFVYPIRNIKERDVQFAFNEILTCLAADVVLFNSNYNRDTLLDTLPKLIKLFPDNRPDAQHIRRRIEAKSKVLYYPIDFVQYSQLEKEHLLHIVWPHRWEFDKNPKDIWSVLIRLQNDQFRFRVSFLGGNYSELPPEFDQRDQLADSIAHFGFVESYEQYLDILRTSHVAVSTAIHEFFGVSMIEAVYSGCFPLVPNRLVYPEIYPSQCLYNDIGDLYDKLKVLCVNPELAVKRYDSLNIDLSGYSAEKLMPKFKKEIYE